MFVILTYDVNSKRVKKALKVSRQYLHRVQKTVFEGNITEASLVRLKKALEDIIEPQMDSVRIYILNSAKFSRMEVLGAVECTGHIL